MSDTRTKHIRWLRVCRFAASEFSTCAKRQYFAVVLDRNGRVASTGYNGAPPGVRHCVDGGCPRFEEGSAPGSSYDNCIALHAEENALLWSDRSAREGGAVVVNGPPCWACGRRIAGSGVAELVFIRDASYADWDRVLSLLASAGVQCFGYDLDDLEVTDPAPPK